MKSLSLKRVESIFDKKEYELVVNMPYNFNGFFNYGYGLSKEEYLEFIKLMYDNSRGIDLPEGYVTQIYYFVYLDNTPIGIVKLRPVLNERLREHGGNMGIALSKDYSGKGYGTKILSMVCDMLVNKYNANEIILTNNEDNIASRRICEKNNFTLKSINSDNLCKYIKIIDKEGKK